MAASIASTTATLRPVAGGNCVSFKNDLGADLEQGQVIVVEELVGVVSEYEVKQNEVGTLDVPKMVQYEGPIAAATEVLAGERVGLDSSGNVVLDSDAALVAGTAVFLALPKVLPISGPTGGLNGTTDASANGDTIIRIGHVDD